MSFSRKQLGQQGENLAAEFLFSKGYKLIAKNLTFPQGEIDLLMAYGRMIVLVEVKRQSSGTFSDPLLKINPAKQRKLRLLAALIEAKYPDRDIRIDAVTLTGELDGKVVISHYEQILD